MSQSIEPSANYAYMQNRELSWLEFNKRVLDQGADPAVPLFDRLSFVSIFWSNLSEFFMIRVGSLTDLSFVKKTIIDSKSGLTPQEQLDAIYSRCHELYPYYEQCYKTLRKEFARTGIENTRGKNLTEDQLDFLNDYFDANIMTFLSPQIVNSRHPFPHLENGAIYVVVRLDDEAAKEAAKSEKAAKKKAKLEAAMKGNAAVSKEPGKDGKDGKKKANNVGAEGVTLGIIPLPRQCKRVIRIPGQGLQFVLLEHLIEMNVERIFSMYKVKHTNVICVTRNADLDATEGAEEQGEDYREHIKRILKKRTRLAPVRLESERELSATVKQTLLGRLDLKSHQTFVTSVPLDMSYVYELPNMVDANVREELSLKPFTPQWPASLSRNRRVLDQVIEREVLINYPYQSMDAFVQLLREAAVDPDVISIKITLYRLAKQSHLAEALIGAAENGKEVTAVFELRARFDEANNIEWSQRFEQAGCNVLYGFRDYKVHSKVCCITRQTPDGVQYITQLGTGNYNEKTAKLYTDFSFITTDAGIGRDVAAFFRNMTLENLSDEYREIWVAPLQIKQNICAGIDEQIALARAGKPAGLFFKTNSITDKEIIDKIVEASQAGVKCTLLVRGISCIVPGIKGYTENVAVVSIVGRLLEHSRIYLFGTFDGDCKIYLSSADLMTRNMDKRVEVAWPIKDKTLREEIIGYIGTCMADTAKLRDLLPNRKYTDLGFFAKSKKDGEVELFDSQDYLINEARRKLMEASETVLASKMPDTNVVRDIAEDEIDLEQMGEEASEFKEAAVRLEDAAHTEDAAKSEDKTFAKTIRSVFGIRSHHDTPTISIELEEGPKESKVKYPSIEGLYKPEPNPEGKFTVPSMDGGTVEVERAGGPVPYPEEDDSESASQYADRGSADSHIEDGDHKETKKASEGILEEGDKEGDLEDGLEKDHGDDDSLAGLNDYDAFIVESLSESGFPASDSFDNFTGYSFENKGTENNFGNDARLDPGSTVSNGEMQPNGDPKAAGIPMEAKVEGYELDGNVYASRDASAFQEGQGYQMTQEQMQAQYAQQQAYYQQLAAQQAQAAQAIEQSPQAQAQQAQAQLQQAQTQQLQAQQEQMQQAQAQQTQIQQAQAQQAYYQQQLYNQQYSQQYGQSYESEEPEEPEEKKRGFFWRRRRQ